MREAAGKVVIRDADVPFLTPPTTRHYGQARSEVARRQGDLVAETSLRSRMAERWAQVESALSMVLLLAVSGLSLLAQFVRPVGDALQGNIYIGGALLSLVGYLLYSQVNRLNAAHDAQREATGSLRDTIGVLSEQVAELSAVQRPRAGAEVTPNGLAGEFRDALSRVEDVHLAALAFTGETLAVPLKQLLGSLPPNPRRSVAVRVLVPDFTQEIDVPGLVRADGKAADSPGFRAHLVSKIKGYESDLKGMIGRMQHHGQGTLTVEFRVLHMSPVLKMYFVNRDQVFEGIYDKIELRPDEYGPLPAAQGTGPDGDDKLLDLLGYDSLLTRWHWDDGPRAREIIDRRRELFETYWRAARPLEANSVPGGRTGRAGRSGRSGTSGARTGGTVGSGSAG